MLVRPNGEWKKLRVLAVGPRIQTSINGKQVADVTGEKTYAVCRSGAIALQVRGVEAEGRSPICNRERRTRFS